jgi:hypothetical protein
MQLTIRHSSLCKNVNVTLRAENLSIHTTDNHLKKHCKSHSYTLAMQKHIGLSRSKNGASGGKHKLAYKMKQIALAAAIIKRIIFQ